MLYTYSWVGCNISTWSKTTPGPGNIVGGQRKVMNKRPTGASEANRQRQPIGAGGLYRLFKDEATGLKMGPQTILITALAYIGVVVVLHILSRINNAF
ncbi:protein transport protein SEC61 subunit beta (Sec61-beta) [Babesia microti strain RI]|uniref:Protein transport protein SEC61 subunit beta (Sec61-beta) n=1 Tax=Babesia microti (strain RI) TaxID=1133968 RepID=I7JDT2_BABMR|nr:protein transport protein SEC61 subunit beta (Sec61-beta) [Babesia microti strain RI]CCF75995.1 protein transport protein SEC61 subunit beta (Sec61-beta) [Babesia microti strain RI]|eukprot:XP_012650403.1 protein transport protein SEC61 subunit beta (Sec61-beta) [Babesia microti strain RI]